MKKDSKTKLLKAALKEFAKNGFNGATTRDIANKADLNISSIMYYFGGKKALYQAALELIVKDVNLLLEDMLEKYNGVKDKPKEASQLLKDLISRFLSILVDDNLSKDVKGIFILEYFMPSENFYILYEGLILPFHKKISRLMIIASNKRIKEKDALLYTFPIFAQLFMFSSRKGAICQLMNWSDIGEKERRQLLKSIDNQLDSLINPQ